VRIFVCSLLLIAALLGVVVDGTAESGLRIVVWKARRELWVFRGGDVVRRYPVSLGRDPKGPKRLRGDGRTPEGRYLVVDKKADSKFHRFLALNYPSAADAEQALRDGLITADVWADVWIAEVRHRHPPTDTILGTRVGIHGIGATGVRERLRRVSDWTEGCVALSDRDIEELFEMAPIGTPVEIFE
jgi:murein L,D-transpeptidase YafK